MDMKKSTLLLKYFNIYYGNGTYNNLTPSEVDTLIKILNIENPKERNKKMGDFHTKLFKIIKYWGNE